MDLPKSEQIIPVESICNSINDKIPFRIISNNPDFLDLYDKFKDAYNTLNISMCITKDQVNTLNGMWGISVVDIIKNSAINEIKENIISGYSKYAITFGEALAERIGYEKCGFYKKDIEEGFNILHSLNDDNEHKKCIMVSHTMLIDLMNDENFEYNKQTGTTFYKVGTYYNDIDVYLNGLIPYSKDPESSKFLMVFYNDGITLNLFDDSLVVENVLSEVTMAPKINVNCKLVFDTNGEKLDTDLPNNNFLVVWPLPKKD